ncbi:MAG: hypothetical protein JNK29_10880 [Anaerolineales bacterium]|nr:hypothetical protein [Anaerolineales bacterium]
MPASTDTLVALAAALLCGGGIIALLAGGLTLASSRRQGRQAYFRLRRQTLLRGWRELFWGVLLLGAAGLLWSFGGAVLRLVLPPTATPAVSAPATATPPVTSVSAATAALLTAPPAAATATPTASAPPAPILSVTAGPSPTPALPAALVTRPAEDLTVTPPAEARVAGLRLSRFNDCASERGVNTTFTTSAKPLYALFYYDGWLPNVEWSSVWLHDGVPVRVETRVWDGSTGGCGFADYDAGGQPWPEGVYEVRIFIGDRWLGSTTFTIYDQTPTPAP